MTPLLEVRDLTVRFRREEGEVMAVNHLSYGIERGETLGVVGESGSGKSVHALSVLGLVPQPPGRIAGGQVLFEGRDLLTLPPAELRNLRGGKIAMVFQDPISSLNPVYSVGFQIVESLRCHLGLRSGPAKRRAAELLDLVGIPDPKLRLRAFPHQLSGGMRQRVMIAMALACEPKLLIADEPTTALDVTIQAQIVELVKRLSRELQLTVMWISHDLGLVAGLAQRVNVMYAGFLVERGPVAALYERPLHPYMAGLLASMPRMDRRTEESLSAIAGRPPDLTRLGSGCPFAARCGLADQRCREEMPPLQEPAEAGRLVRCWHWQRMAEGAAGHA
ncbi:MAG: ABC transporter ATP-binding protein [Pseudomonadota bacterium]